MSREHREQGVPLPRPYITHRTSPYQTYKPMFSRYPLYDHACSESRGSSNPSPHPWRSLRTVPVYIVKQSSQTFLPIQHGVAGENNNVFTVLYYDHGCTESRGASTPPIPVASGGNVWACRCKSLRPASYTVCPTPKYCH